jgi:hypothetical protein
MPDFRIHLAGHLDDRCRAAFAGLEVTTEASSTLLRGNLDQAGLHGVLERARVLGIEVLEVRRVRRPRSSQAGT